VLLLSLVLMMRVLVLML
jgi:hypothetical protein